MAAENQPSFKDAESIVDASEVRKEVVRELYLADEKMRPSHLQELVCPRTGTSPGSIYQALRTLRENSIVEKEKGKGKATYYLLTEFGTEVAEEMGLDEEPTDDGPVDLGVAGAGGVDDEVAPGFNAEMPERTSHSSDSEGDVHVSDIAPVDDFRGEPDHERVEQLQDELSSFLKRTNVSMDELDEAVTKLKQETK